MAQSNSFKDSLKVKTAQPKTSNMKGSLKSSSSNANKPAGSSKSSSNFKDSLKVKNYQHPKVSQNSKSKSTANTPGEKGNKGRSKGGMTR